jgi:hypothetical protein
LRKYIAVTVHERGLLGSSPWARPASLREVKVCERSSFDIGEETSRRRMERAGVWLTSTNTMVAELVHNWATPQGMKLVPLIAANPPMLPVD